MRLVTVIAADELEVELVTEFKSLGATGYTVLPAQGEGSHGARTSGLEGGNVLLETIVDPDAAHRVVAQLHEKFQPRHALVIYVTSIEVVRGEKFVTQPPAAP
jgi:hypothetical protein